ncbi:MAG: hypothetical protein KDD62_03335 [Bdellovibrionales bacterium]|nr:hypothetical protein [Bdellovibrionales bacterium]
MTKARLVILTITFTMSCLAINANKSHADDVPLSTIEANCTGMYFDNPLLCEPGFDNCYKDYQTCIEQAQAFANNLRKNPIAIDTRRCIGVRDRCFQDVSSESLCPSRVPGNEPGIFVHECTYLSKCLYDYYRCEGNPANCSEDLRACSESIKKALLS